MKTMNRREFCFNNLMLLGSSMLGQVASQSENKLPNIIYVIADQLRYQSCGYVGDRQAHTPNIDKLATEGVNFTQMVSNMPVCCAYRASLWTGKYTSSTGMVINELRMNTNHTCLAHCLTQSGYDTAFIGKWHLFANQLGNHYDPKNSFTPRGLYRLGFDGYWASFGYGDRFYNAYYHTETPDKIYHGEGVFETDGLTDLAIDYLNKASQKDKPFAMVLSVNTPHPPWNVKNVPPKHYEMFNDEKFLIPPNYSDEMCPYGDAWSNTRKSPEQVEQSKRVYYAMTANLDENVGRLLRAIDQAGIRNNTIFVFTSDHGEMFGAHGRMAKNIFYEEAARVPFLIRWPGKIPAGMVSEACMSTVDIMPTLLGLTGIAIPPEVEGADLSHLALGKNGSSPEYAFLMNTGACASWEDGHEWRALRNKNYTYAIFRKDGKEMLFNNIFDPFQMNNLAQDPDYASLIQDLRGKLKEKMESLKDTFPPSSWYRENWIENRIIMRTATVT